MVKGEIKVGDRTITEADLQELHANHTAASAMKDAIALMATECCEIFGIDPHADSVARDIAEEIVLHGTPVAEVIERLQKRLEESQ